MATTPDTTPYDRVQALRAERGWSERECCRQAGLAENLLAQRRSSRNLSLESLEAFAKGFGIPRHQLTGEAPAAAGAGTAATANHVPWHQLVASSFNPRRTLDEALLADLAESIATSGLLQNLVVREIHGDAVGIADRAGNRRPLLEVIAGERRYRAIGLLVKAGRWNPDEANVAVHILDANDGDALAVALLENLQREDVPPIEEAEAFARLQDLDPKTWTTEAIAARIHKTERHVQGRIALARKLTDQAKDAVREGQISISQARAIAMAKPKEQAKLVAEASTNRWMTEEKIREQLTRNLPHEKYALFDVRVYEGEFVERERPGEPRRFADRKAFDALQKPFIDAKIAKLKKKWAFVEVRKGNPYWWDYEDSKGEDAGAVLFIESSGQIHQKTGLVKKQSGVGSRMAGETAEQKAAREEAARVKAEAFDTAAETMKKEIAERLRHRPDLALVLLAATLLTSEAIGCLAIEAEHLDEAEQDAELSFLRPKDGISVSAYLDRLAAYSRDDILMILSRLAAERFTLTDGWRRITYFGVPWVAMRLDLAVPEALARDAAEEDDDDAPFEDNPAEERACRVCGCTEDYACEGGCSWVEEDLCSACVGQGQAETAEDREAA